MPRPRSKLNVGVSQGQLEGIERSAKGELNFVDPTPTDSEAVKATLRGIRRTVGAAKVRKAPAVAAKVRAMVALAPEGLKGVRDRALLLLGADFTDCEH